MATKRLRPIPQPTFLTPSDLPPLDFVFPKEERRRDGIKTTNVLKTDNFGLLISRFIPFQVVRNEKEDAIIEVKEDRRTGKDRETVYQTMRSHWFEHCTLNYTTANKSIANLINSTNVRWTAMTEGAARFSMVTRSRMIIGLGSKGALEFGITLHPVTGLPYIPGSALKGLCRNYALLFIAERWKIDIVAEPPMPQDTPQQRQKKLEKPSQTLKQLDEALMGVASDQPIREAEMATLFQNMFGTQEKAGQCVFFDAIIRDIPQDKPTFALEVMTPHFPEYYRSGGGQAPHDADNPNPVTFIAVNEGIRFRFAVGTRRNVSKDESLLGNASYLLQEALKLMGIGAKTAAGYGVFGAVSTKQ